MSELFTRLSILAVVLMSLSLAGCWNSYVVPIDPRLTVDCANPELSGDTYRDVVALAVEQKASILECTDRMRIIKKTQQ